MDQLNTPTPETPSYKEYLGDAVYVDFDGYHIVLTTEDGIQATNTVYLEPQVLDAFNKYVEKLTKNAS